MEYSKSKKAGELHFMHIKYYKNPYVTPDMYPRVILLMGERGFAVLGPKFGEMESLTKGLDWTLNEIRRFPGGENENRITRKQAEKMLGKGLRQFIDLLHIESAAKDGIYIKNYKSVSRNDLS